MGWNPLTFCAECDEAFDEYHAPNERLCECCAEWLRIEAAEDRAKYETDLPKEETNEHAR